MIPAEPAQEDIEAINTNCGLEMETPQDVLKNRRSLFRRQLSAAQETCTFMIPRMDASGSTLSPSESLVFIHQMIDGVESSEDLILDLDRADDRQKAAFLPLAPDSEPTPPRQPQLTDIQLEHNLLTIGAKEEGQLRALSPSGLENLMVSPLAWLLRRLNSEPKEWTPETPNVAIRGTLAHAVFESLFIQDSDIPSEQNITDTVPKLFHTAITERAPYLHAAQWQVERQNLEREIREAAIAWGHVLTALDSKILAAEIWLEGKLGTVPIHGQADTVLKLPDGKLLVVDLKKSGSGKRKTRMEKGFDSQVNLYRTMIQTGGAKNEEHQHVNEEFKKTPQTDVLYFMMNDQTVLADAINETAQDIPGWTTISNDVSVEAMSKIKDRIEEVRSGLIRLNTEADADFFEKKAAMTPYALDVSPIIRLFMQPAPEEEEAE